ncbi:MAG TPA: peptide-binding protein [Thermoanaerobaculia bacterium]|nr:peptide-binding protein [Thermoanaerobaculia bacterium]
MTAGGLRIAPILFLAGAACYANAPPQSGTAPFVFDGNRVYAELSFLRPDGSLHPALAFVDSGSASMTITASLARELALDRGRPLSFRVGELNVTLPATEVIADPSPPYAVGSDLKVEAVLAASLLQRFEVVLDYRRHTLTLAEPGTIRPEGTATAFRVNPKTGLIAVDASIDGRSYPVTIDTGSAYTWLRQDAVRTWLAANPGWERGVGAVGASNMTMSGDGSEANGILLRIPRVLLGKLALREVGALGVRGGRSPVDGVDLLDWYATKNAVPVIGWIGGNVLKSFRLTFDYEKNTLYWLAQREPDTHDLDQVGLTLKRETGEFVVGAVASKNEKPTVEGVLAGDRLVRIDGLETKGATWGRVYEALHGKPGDVRVLLLQRGPDRITVRASVTGF